MYDRDLALEILRQLRQAGKTILKRFEPVKSVKDFTDSFQGMEKLDSICMLLVATGESLKNLDKVTDFTLLPQYPQIDWQKAKGMRDFISHHYFEIDAEVVYFTCEHHIIPLIKTIELMINYLHEGRA